MTEPSVPRIMRTRKPPKPKKRDEVVLTNLHCGWDFRKKKHSGYGCKRLVSNLSCRFTGRHDGKNLDLHVCSKCHDILAGRRDSNGRLKEQYR